MLRTVTYLSVTVERFPQHRIETDSGTVAARFDERERPLILHPLIVVRRFDRHYLR